jgi:hypothetical protein
MARSLSLAASSSLSSMMYVDLIHSARPASMLSASSFCSASSMNLRASSGVAWRRAQPVAAASAAASRMAESFIVSLRYQNPARPRLCQRRDA